MNEEQPAIPSELLEGVDTDGLVNLYATVTPAGFTVRKLDTHKVVLHHDGRVMTFHDPSGEVIYTMDHTEAMSDDVDESGNIDLLMNLAWGEGMANDLHTILESFTLAIEPLLTDALRGMEDDE